MTQRVKGRVLLMGSSLPLVVRDARELHMLVKSRKDTDNLPRFFGNESGHKINTGLTQIRSAPLTLLTLAIADFVPHVPATPAVIAAMRRLSDISVFCGAFQCKRKNHTLA